MRPEAISRTRVRLMGRVAISATGLETQWRPGSELATPLRPLAPLGDRRIATDPTDWPLKPSEVPPPSIRRGRERSPDRHHNILPRRPRWGHLALGPSTCSAIGFMKFFGFVRGGA